MNYNEVLANARENIGKLCKACPVCNGLACRNTVPGPGAKGVGDTAIHPQLPEVAGDQSEYGSIVCAEGSGYIP